MLNKYKENKNIEFAPVYFNSTTKTIIGRECNLDKSFQEVFNKTDSWISETYGWINESTNGEYVNIYIYSSISGGSYIEFPNEFQ